MTDTALDFLLEKMMPLVNGNDELIVEAYRGERIDMHQIEWVYEEIQSLREFLRDSEEKRDEYEKLNEIAANIRDVTYRIDDIIDGFLLLVTFQRDDIIDSNLMRMEIELMDTLAVSSDYITSNLPYPINNVNVQIWKCLHFLFNNFALFVNLSCVFLGAAGLTAAGLTVTTHFFGSLKPITDMIVMCSAFLCAAFVILFDDHLSRYVLITPIKVLTRKWRDFLFRKYLSDVMEEIKLIKAQVMEIYEKKMYGIGIIGVPQIGKPSHGASSTPISPTLEEETIVGFDDEANTIMELLTEEHEKQLKVVSIVGMPGLGKTTIAKKVYDDPLIKYYFHICTWTSVSQVYQKRDLLLAIFHSAFQFRNENCQISNEKLGEELYKRLKGRKYLLVLDDIWNLQAWDDLKIYFPNNKNGSRILCTSRHEGVAVALHAKFHRLRFLDENESWDLFQPKTFRKDSCPLELMETGKQIAKKCRGLPLAIIVISGLLAKEDRTLERWRHVAESVSSYIVRDPEKYMDTLALSYNHLPQHLKPCFLYFGAFPEDYEILVWQLIWLWVAEGFIRQNDQKSLEEVAEDYLMDLIDRNLVIVSKKRSNGGIKMCRVHDLLRDLCLRKAQEEDFLQQISSIPWKDASFVCKAFKLLRVLNLLSIKILFFPKEIEQLVHLRYLALYVEREHEPLALYVEHEPLPLYVEQEHVPFQPSISNLQNLETLIVDGLKGSLFLNDVWKMMKLRHVHTRRLIKIDSPLDDGCPFVLDNLQTIGKLNILHNGDECVLKRSPNLKKLKCQCYHFPRLEFLIHLEKLNLVYDGYERFSHLGKFPTNLKSLTLSNFGLPWKAMSTLGSLPNLKVLKLSYKAFEGPRWDTIDGEFRRLRFLKVQGLDIEQWNVSGNHFPNLQTLVLDNCERLEETPSSLGDISTLEMIQVQWCSYSVENSARQLQEQQHNMGNDGLKIHIHSLNHS